MQEFFDGDGEELAREGTLRGAFFEERGEGAGNARRVEDGGYARRGGAAVMRGGEGQFGKKIVSAGGLQNQEPEKAGRQTQRQRHHTFRVAS